MMDIFSINTYYLITLSRLEGKSEGRSDSLAIWKARGEQEGLDVFTIDGRSLFELHHSSAMLWIIPFNNK